MTRIEAAKLITKFVVGSSVSFTVSNIVGNNVNVSKPHQQVEAWVAAIVIGMMAAEGAEKWTNQKIEAIAEWWTKNVTAQTQSN